MKILAVLTHAALQKTNQPRDRIELSIFPLQGECVNHCATAAASHYLPLIKEFVYMLAFHKTTHNITNIPKHSNFLALYTLTFLFLMFNAELPLLDFYGLIFRGILSSRMLILDFLLDGRKFDFSVKP